MESTTLSDKEIQLRIAVDRYGLADKQQDINTLVIAMEVVRPQLMRSPYFMEAAQSEGFIDSWRDFTEQNHRMGPEHQRKLISYNISVAHLDKSHTLLDCFNRAVQKLGLDYHRSFSFRTDFLKYVRVYFIDEQDI